MPEDSNAVTITLRATPEMLARVRDLQAAVLLKRSQLNPQSDPDGADNLGNNRNLPVPQQNCAEDSVA